MFGFLARFSTSPCQGSDETRVHGRLVPLHWVHANRTPNSSLFLYTAVRFLVVVVAVADPDRRHIVSIATAVALLD